MGGPQRHYGFDLLSVCCVALAAILAWVPFGFILSLILIGWALFRALSSNVQARSAEALWFTNHTRGLRSWALTAFFRLRLWWRRMLERVHYWQTYKVFRCKKCGQKLRVPRGKGKLRVTCKNCKEQFSIKS